MRKSHPGVVMLILCASVFAQGDEARDDYNFAAGLHDRGLHARAARAFSSYLKKWPDDSRVPKAHHYLGESLLASGKGEEATAAFITSSRSDHPLKLASHLRAGELLHRAAKHTAAIPHLVAVADADGADPGSREAALYFLGEAHVASGARDRGRARYLALIDRFGTGPYAPYARSAVGFLHFEDGDTKSALAAFKSVTSTDEPEVAIEARVMIGECHLALGAPAKALRVFESISLDDAGTHQVTVALGKLRSHLATDQFAEGIADYQRFRRQWPKDARAHAAMIRAAAALHEQGRNEDGLRIISAVDGAEGKEGRDHAYWSGLLLTRTGRLDDAIKRLRQAVAADPSPRRKFSLADALSQKGDYDEAAMLFEQTRKGAKDAEVIAEAGFGEAFARTRIGQHERAVALLQTVRASGASQDLLHDARFALAENLFTLERYDEARAHYDALLAAENVTQGRREACLYKLGWCDYLTRKHDRAIVLLSRLIKEHPESSFVAEGRYLIGKCHEAEGRHGESRAAFEASAKANPDPVMRVNAMMGAAAAAYRGDDLAAAARGYRRAARSTKDATVRGNALASLGDVLSDDGKPGEAEAVYAVVLKEHAGHPRAEACRLGRAWALRALDRHGEAVKVAEPLVEGAKEPVIRGEARWLQALEASEAKAWPRVAALLDGFEKRCPGHPRIPESTLLLGLCRARQGQHEPAMQILGKIAGQGPDTHGHATALYELGFLHERTGDKDARDRAFAELVKAHPNSSLIPDTLFRLGEAHYDRGKFQGALTRYAELAKHSDAGPLRDKARYKAGWCLKKLERPREAAREFEQVADMKSPLAAESCFLAADQHDAAGDHQKAMTWFGRMRERHSDHELVVEARLRKVLCLKNLERWEDVVAQAPQALDLEGDAAWKLRVQSALGDAFYARQSWDRARAAYRIVTRSDGALAARAQFRIGRALEQQGRGDDAIDALLKVSILYEHAPWVARAALKAADLLLAGGQAGKAKRLYNEVMRKHGGTPEAKAAREKLEAAKKGGQR